MDASILKELRKPFHPSQVTWKPGAVNHEGTKALGLAYADLRAYQNRLDELFGMEWTVSYTPWAERIICHLTIGGVTRSSTGEPDSQSERSEIAGTATEAQAFKRACAMFGLGRYLYTMPSIWVEYSRESRYFSDRGKARLDALIANHYARAQAEEGAEEEQDGAGNEGGAEEERSAEELRPGTTAPAEAPSAEQQRRIWAEEVIASEGLNTIGKVWVWAAKYGYKPGVAEAEADWMDQTRGQKTTPANIKENVIRYIARCHKDGKREVLETA